MLLYQTLDLLYVEKYKTVKIINLKYQLQHGMMSLNYLMDHILYQKFKAILSISSKNMRQLLTILQ